MASRAPRDNSGLTFEQRQILLALSSGRSLKEACDEYNIAQRRVYTWLDIANHPQDKAFKEQWDTLASIADIESIRSVLGNAALSAAGVFEDAIANANKTIKEQIECPHCFKKFQHNTVVEDWKARLDAAKTLLKINGVLVERTASKVDVTVHRQLEFHEITALTAWNAGLPISPDMEHNLRQLGAINTPLALPSGEVVEGSFTEVEDEA